MREVKIYRADGSRIEPITISIHRPLPPISYDDPLYAVQTRDRFTLEGAALADALWTSCPGGTLDMLIANLLTRRASLFRVTFGRD